MDLKKIWLLGLNLILQKRSFYTFYGDTNATYQLSDILLEYDATFNEPYTTSICEIYTRTTSILYTKVTSIHYQTLSKIDTTWKIDVNNISTRSLQGLLLLFLDKRDDFANKNEEFYNPSINYHFWWQLMACLTSSLGLDYWQDKFIQRYINIFTKKTLVWCGKIF